MNVVKAEELFEMGMKNFEELISVVGNREVLCTDGVEVTAEEFISFVQYMKSSLLAFARDIAYAKENALRNAESYNKAFLVNTTASKLFLELAKSSEENDERLSEKYVSLMIDSQEDANANNEAVTKAFWSQQVYTQFYLMLAYDVRCAMRNFVRTKRKAESLTKDVEDVKALPPS